MSLRRRDASSMLAPVIALLVGCGAPQSPTQTVDDEGGNDETDTYSSPPPEATPAPEPEPAPQPEPEPIPAPTANTSGCSADQQHCCQPDGTVVRPGGCQPSYPAGVAAGVNRGADGLCVQTSCYLRCMPGDARIATPDGDVPIRELEVGDVVFTEGQRGRRVTSRLLRVSAVPVDEPHSMSRLRLSDGRRVRASPGHPTASGLELSTLALGAPLDGASIVDIEETPYDGAYTYDVLPAGPTGVYWADGVRLGSTLSVSGSPEP